MKRLLPLLLLTTTLLGYTLETTHKDQSSTTQEVTLTFTLGENEDLYKEGLLPSVSTNHVTLSPLKSSQEPITFFDEIYKKDMQGYAGTPSFTLTATRSPELTSSDVVIHLHYRISGEKQPQEKIIPLHFTLPEKQTVQSTVTVPSTKPIAQVQPLDCKPSQPSLLGNLIGKTLNSISVSITHTRSFLSSLFTSTGSKTIRMLVALLLGLLLSLTPCIYPMIPITIGVLQASGSSSGSRNFLLALFYTLGISLTFAILGFIASIGSCIFGELQGSPYIIMPLSALLIYLGLTMFDIVSLPIPQWLQPKSTTRGGTFGAAFVFGALSGTVASPCLSPGLLLILNYVANVGTASVAAYLEGFLLLFIFGV